MSNDPRRIARLAASMRQLLFKLPLCLAALLLLAAVASDRAAADVAFLDVLSNKPLDVPLPEGAQRTEAVVHFHKTGENFYSGKGDAIAAGKKIYTGLCASCHLPNATGRLGPSLIDNESKYPRMNTDVGMFEIIYGGGAGAMQAFSKRGMSQDDMLQVMAYINSLRK
jgi:cytochrome c-L